MHGRPWVFPYVKRATVAVQKFQVSRIQSERHNFPPFWANKFGDVRARVPALIDEKRELNRLPAVGIDDVGVARHFGLDVGIDGLVAIRGIPLSFVGAVLQAKCNDLLSDVIAQCRRTVVHVIR